MDFLGDVSNHRILACTVTTIDSMAHGAELGPAALYRDISYWMKSGGFEELVKFLSSSGFLVYITSDHGTIYSTGIGRPHEGALADNKGERVRIFNSEHLLDIVKEKIEGIKWNNYGLPPDCHVLLAKGRTAFITEGESSITHGGLSLEEVIVPFVELRRKSHC